MQDYNKRFYIWGVIVLIVISLSFFLQYVNNNNLLLNNVERMTEMSADVLNERINNWLNNKGQLINNAKNYIEMGGHTDEEILKYLEVLLIKNEELEIIGGLITNSLHGNLLFYINKKSNISVEELKQKIKLEVTYIIKRGEKK